MADIDQKERADAYYRNVIALIFYARVELYARLRDHGDDVEAAAIRHRLRGLVAIVDQTEAAEYHDKCEACDKPLIDGQQVIYYAEDAVTTHADCDNPFRVMSQPDSHMYDSGYSPAECVAELEKAKAALADAEDEAHG